MNYICDFQEYCNVILKVVIYISLTLVRRKQTNNINRSLHISTSQRINERHQEF